MRRGAPLLLALLSACAAPAAAPTARSNPDPARFEQEIVRYDAADRERPTAPGGVVFAGSSSFRLWNTLERDFPSVRVLNRGFGGSEMSDLVHYADRLILPHRPRLVLVYEGDNDISSGKSPEQVLADYRALVSRIHRELPDTRVAFVSIKPSPSRWHLAPQVRRANDLIRDFSSRDPRLLYIDVFTPMLGPDGAPREELFVQDRLHMNEKGYEIWKSVIGPYLSEQGTRR